MNAVDNYHVNILDLPNEILSIIFQKLNMIDVLYSLVDVNRRFERLVLDPLHLHDLDLTDIITINSINTQASIDIRILPSICRNILPRIHHQAHQLTVERCSMKQVLRAATYPQLYSLSLLNFDAKTLLRFLRDDLILRDLLAKQITHLKLDIKSSTTSNAAEIFELILSLCSNLIALNFGDMFIRRACRTMVLMRLQNCMSSTLMKLKIHVATYIDCLLLLDGRLECLSTLIIKVSQVFEPTVDIGGGRKLPKLKCFSFTSDNQMFEYDHLIVPLLCRMINLEELQLHLSVRRYNGNYIDGVQLYNQFLIYMTQLDKFSFDIRTYIYNNADIGIELQSDEEIQKSFAARHYQRVASYVYTTPEETGGECRIYSLPYAFDYFMYDNSFSPGGMFYRVRYMKMSAERSFEYRLFELISHELPFLEMLVVSNSFPQKKKKHPTTSIILPYLTFLSLNCAHDDYAEQLLLKNHTYLPRLLNLRIQYQSLERITNNFIEDAKQFNFSTLKNLDVYESFVRRENFREYFPLL